MKTKEKRFERIIEWDNEHFESKFIFNIVALVMLPFTIIFFTFFGWVYGLWWFINHNKEKLEEYETIYWKEIK